MVAADADAERRLDDSLDLLVEEVRGALGEVFALAQALALGEAADLDPGLDLADDDQPPGLHQADRRGLVGGPEDAIEDVGGNLVGAEAADVAALGDDPVDGLTLLGGVAPTTRIGRSLGRSRGVEALGSWRSAEAIPGVHAAEP